MDRHPAAPTFGRKEQALARATPRNAVASQRHPRLGIRAPGTIRLWETLELKGISGSESPDPVVGGGSARSLCTRRRPPRNTLLRVACPARPPTPHRRHRARPLLAGALGLLSFWGAWSSLLFLLCPLGDADRTNGNRREFEGLSTAATSEPDASRHGGNRADRSQRISERAESRGCRPQAPRVCAARLCRSPLSGARTGMVTRGVRRTACTRRPRALRRASFPVICGGRTAFPLRLLPRPSSHSQMMCLTFSDFSSADAQERDRDKSG